MSLTVIIPFFNEEKTLSDSILRVLNENIDLKILLVDDKSTDGSLVIANKFVQNYQNINLIQNKSNLGKGAALSLSQKFIETSHVIIHDADLEYFPSDFHKLLAKSNQYPDSLILGSRFIGNKARKNIYKRTYIANKVMSLFFSLIHFVKITDIATCYKLLPAEFFKQVNIVEKGFSIEVEIVSKFLKHNKSVYEVPISYSGRSYEEGKKIKISDGFYYLINTIKYRILN
jgi:glycosyltransferase involved in cell wall biosynthesis